MAERRSAGLAHRTGLIAVGQGAVKLVQLLLAVFLVRLLAPTEWNTVAHLLSIHLALVMLGTLNLQHGLLFFMPRVGRERSLALVAQTAGLIALVSAAIVITCAVLGATMGSGELHTARWLPWIGVAAALELPTACAPAALIATERLRAAACWDLGAAAITMTAVVVPAATGHGVRGVVVGLVAGASVRVVAFVAVLLTRFDGPLIGLPPGTLAQQLYYGLPLGLTIGASVLNRSVDKWFVALWRPDEVGVYAIAAQEIPLLAVLPYAAGAAMAAAVARSFYTGDRSAAHRAWIAQTSAMSVLVVPMSVLLMLVAPELFAAFLTPEFERGIPAFRVFTAITLHRVAEYGLVLRAAGHTSDLFRAAVVLLASNALLAGVGAATFGMTGASVGTLVANMIAWGYVLVRMSIVFGCRVVNVFPWCVWASSLTVSLGALLVSRAVVSHLEAPPLAQAGLMAAVFVPCVVVAGQLAGLGRHLRLADAVSAAFDRGGRDGRPAVEVPT